MKYVGNVKLHYGLRKLSIGVASVLLGITVAGVNVSADSNAETKNPVNDSKNINVDANEKLQQKEIAINGQQGNVSSSVNNNSQTLKISRGEATENNNVANTVSEQKVQAASANNNDDWSRNGYYQARASNVDFELTNTYGHSTGSVLPAENNVGFTGNIHFGLKTTFSLRTSDLKIGSHVYLGTFKLSNSLDDPSHTVPVRWDSSLGKFNYQGKYIGDINCHYVNASNLDFYINVESNNNYVTPTITADWINNDICGYNWDSAPSIYKDVPDHFDEYFDLPGDHRFTFHMWNDIEEAKGYNTRTLGVVGSHEFNLYDGASPSIIKNGGYWWLNWTADQLNSFNNENAEGVALPNTGYQVAYSFHPSSDQVVPSTVNVVYDLLPKDADDKLTYELIQPWGPALYYEKLANGLSLQELKAACLAGHAVYSVQSDGSDLCYINVSPDQLVMNKGWIPDYLKTHSKVIAIGGDKAFQNTINLYFGKALGGRAIKNDFVTGFSSSLSQYDSLTVSNIKVLDPDTGSVLMSRGDWHNQPDILQLSGKAAIHVHYLNGYNGQQIGNTQTFTDNQGKQLSFQAKNPLGLGYHLRNNTDSKLLNGNDSSAGIYLNGNTVSTITYPKENTASDVYYLVDPDSEVLTVSYYDLTGNLVKSQKINGYFDQRVALAFTAPDNYQLVQQELPTSYQYTLYDNEIAVLIAPATKFRSWQSGDSDLIKTVTRTIKILKPDHVEQDVLQTVKFGRNDYVTGGKHSYTGWLPIGENKFSAYLPAIITGYGANSVNEENVSVDDRDQVVSVAYYKLFQPSILPFIDIYGQSYATLPAGYGVVAGQNDSGAKLIVKQVNTPAIPKIEYVTRVITVKMPNGKTRTIKQRARNGSKFIAAHLPRLSGYKVVITGHIDSVSATDNMSAIVNYVKL